MNFYFQIHYVQNLFYAHIIFLLQNFFLSYICKQIFGLNGFEDKNYFD